MNIAHALPEQGQSIPTDSTSGTNPRTNVGPSAPPVGQAANRETAASPKSKTDAMLEKWCTQYGAEHVVWYEFHAGQSPMQRKAWGASGDAELESLQVRIASGCLHHRQPKMTFTPTRRVVLGVPVPGLENEAVVAVVPFQGDAPHPDWTQSLVRDLDYLATKAVIPRLATTVPPQELDESWRNLLQMVARRFVEDASILVRRPRVIALSALFCVLLLSVPWPSRVTCEAKVEPARRRFVSAPFESRLLTSHVKLGDRVEEGQLLAELDGGELKANLASQQAKLSQAMQRRSAAMSQRDASKAELERREIIFLNEEIAVLEKRQEQLEIRSPISGIIVSGDLERVQGAPLKLGETLYEVAPLEELVVELAIPEDRVSEVAAGNTVQVSLDSWSWKWHSTSLTRIHPRNEIRENESVFIAEALLSNGDLRLRPGMNGEASIATGSKPLGWVLFYRPVCAFRHVTGW